MKNAKNNNFINKLINKKILWISVSFLLFIAITWVVFNSLRTYPLGDRLVYKEKKEYGCSVMFIICDAEQHTDYIYATSMKPDEIASYFKKATVLKKQISGSNSLYILHTQDGKDVSLDIKKSDSFNSEYIVTIYDYSYRSLKLSI